MHSLLLGIPACWRGLLLGLLLSLPRLASAQTAPDTTRIRYSEETVSEPELAPRQLGEAYSQLTRLQIEEQTLWKIGLNNFGGISNADSPLFAGRYGLYLIYERKVRPNASVMAELAPDLLRYRTLPGESVRHTLSVRSQVAGRYYYNLNQRIRKGKSASNFSANYLSLAVGSGVGRRAQGTPFYYYYFNKKPAFRADLAILYGLQRRLGRYGFADFNVGFRTKLLPRVADFFPAATFRIGLALGR